MPYVPPQSCPPIAQPTVLTLAYFAALVQHVSDDMQIALEIMSAAPEDRPAYDQLVAERTASHQVLVELYMRQYLDAAALALPDFVVELSTTIREEPA